MTTYNASTRHRFKTATQSLRKCCKWLYLYTKEDYVEDNADRVTFKGTFTQGFVYKSQHVKLFTVNKNTHSLYSQTLICTQVQTTHNFVYVYIVCINIFIRILLSEGKVDVHFACLCRAKITSLFTLL